jgi:predicted RNA binding protein YcfA (HicA-like mRNA interferase family)
MRMKSRDVIKKLKAAGWFEVATKGSHHQFKHPTRKGRVTVPHPSASIAKGTLRSIERQSGVKLLR